MEVSRLLVAVVVFTLTLEASLHRCIRFWQHLPLSAVPAPRMGTPSTCTPPRLTWGIRASAMRTEISLLSRSLGPWRL